MSTASFPVGGIWSTWLELQSPRTKIASAMTSTPGIARSPESGFSGQEKLPTAARFLTGTLPAPFAPSQKVRGALVGSPFVLQGTFWRIWKSTQMSFRNSSVGGRYWPSKGGSASTRIPTISSPGRLGSSGSTSWQCTFTNSAPTASVMVPASEYVPYQDVD